ncbi:energy-coupling factor transporter transmembrane protein EcfT [uncultured Clostridium sp.]|uniref:energy-coupling factor transporter transmembrane component T family protein n=1 Tax=uncultured Clostridium sp. TaxID=59620 RepID=UPI002625BA69|nr:energy-coupling factor transporter transmembrane component T [uncultured Clostridium sp.]
MQTMLEYSNKNSFVHKLTGAAKILFLLAYILASMISYDTRLLVGLLVLSIIIFKVSKVEFKEISFVFYFIIIFLVINTIAIYLISPYQGCEIYGTKTVLFKITNYYQVTSEQLFYQLNFVLKYLLITPMALIFMVATNPSEFAASLNKIGVSYKIAYSVAIALRYVPDIQREYHDIAFAQQARGIDMSKKASAITRVKNASVIIMPLIFSSLEKIDKISCAMEIRAFGSKEKRTWYSGKKFAKSDYAVMIFGLCLVILAGYLVYVNGGRFYNPFI